jgi:hypothetical protein
MNDSISQTPLSASASAAASGNTSSNSAAIARLTSQADQARSLREFAVAIGWLTSAARLETSEQQRDIGSELNKRLVALLYDAATYSEDLVLRCGNVINNHLGWLEQMREISNILLKRLEGTAPDAVSSDSLSRVVLMSGHINALYQRFVVNSHDKLLLPNPVKDIKIFVNTIAEVRAEAAQLAGDLCNERSQLLQLITLGNALGNASSFVYGFPFRVFTDWEHALFFVEEAERYAKKLTAGSDTIASQSEIDNVRELLGKATVALKAHEHSLGKQHIASAASAVKRLSGDR